MGKQAAAQAQEVREEEITAQDSLELVKCLLRVSVYHVCFMRGLFPEKYFRGVDMTNLENLHIKMLNRSDGDDEVKMLIDWVETGVPDAIKRRYLKRMFFGISEDPEAKHLLEEYVFSFSYDDQGYATFELGSRGRTRFSSQASNVKYEVVRLMRMLVQITQTLEKVPEERYIFMKLTYTDHTPDEYEPPHFKEAGDSAAAAFARKPFTMEVGRVGTKHHQVALHVKSVLDTLALEGEEQMVEDNMTVLQQTTTAVPSAAQPAGSEAGGSCAVAMSQDSMPDGQRAGLAQAEEEDVSSGGCHSRAGNGNANGNMQQDWPGGQQQQQQQQRRSHRRHELLIQDLYTEPQQGQAEEARVMLELDGSPASASQQEEELASLRAWLLKRTSVHVVDAMARFGNISSGRLDAYFRRFVEERLLLPTEHPESFTVIKPATLRPAAATAAATPPHAAAAASAATAADCERAMQHLTVADSSRRRGGAAAAPLPLSSEQGGVWDAAGGTQQTQSVVGAPAAARAPLRPSQVQAGQAQEPAAAGVFLEATQPSQAGQGVDAKRRKQSIAKELIRQTGKRRLAAALQREVEQESKQGGAEVAAEAAPAPKSRTRKSRKN